MAINWGKHKLTDTDVGAWEVTKISHEHLSHSTLCELCGLPCTIDSEPNDWAHLQSCFKAHSTAFPPHAHKPTGADIQINSSLRLDTEQAHKQVYSGDLY